MGAIKIAVAVPTYNRPDYLAKLLATIPPAVAVYISDNNNSLNGMGVSRRGAVVSASSNLISMFANWNRALSLVADGATHVIVPSDDDLFSPGAFERIEAILAGAGRDADICIFGCGLVDEHDVTRLGYQPGEKKMYAPGEGFFVFQYGVDARMPGIVFRREFLDRIGTFDERFRVTASDSELVQRALILGRSLFVPDVVAYYRVWSGNATHTRQATQEWMCEIRQWAQKTSAILKATHGENFRGFDERRFRDELIARNVLSGVCRLVARGDISAASRFMRSQGIPRHATFLTRLRLLRQKARIVLAQV